MKWQMAGSDPALADLKGSASKKETAASSSMTAEESTPWAVDTYLARQHPALHLPRPV